jgi:hypothetical protein
MANSVKLHKKLKFIFFINPNSRSNYQHMWKLLSALSLVGSVLGDGPHIYRTDYVHEGNHRMIEDLSEYYTVRLGAFHITGHEICNHAKDVGCQYNNHITPYGFIFLNESTKIQNSKMYRFKLEHNGTFFVPKWNFATDEAVIFGGTIPPDMRYFSFQNYILERDNYGFWKFVFGSIGYSVNNFRLNVRNNEFMVIITPNQLVEQHVEQIVDKYYATNFLKLPHSVPTQYMSTTLRYGYDKKADVFTNLARFAIPSNVTQWEMFRNKPPIWVYRLRVKYQYTSNFKSHINIYQKYGYAQKEATNLYDITNLNPAPALIKGTTKFNELAFEQDMEFLEENLEEHHKNQTVYKSLFSGSGLDLLNIRWGGDCISDWFCINCMGDISDTIYATALPSFNLYQDEILYVYGINHKYVNNTAYTGIVIYDLSAGTAITSVDDTKLLNTASKWLDYTADHLFVYKFMYRCPVNDTDCVEINIGLSGMAEGGLMGILGRDYDGFRPDISELILPRYMIVTNNRIPYRLNTIVIRAIINGHMRTIVVVILVVGLLIGMFYRLIRRLRKQKKD